jgi:hypothetical protein
MSKNTKGYNPAVPVLHYRINGRVYGEHFVTNHARERRKKELEAQGVEIVGQ